MNKDELVYEILDFYIKYGLFKDNLNVSKTDELKKKIAYQLNDSAFVESLIRTVCKISERFNTVNDEQIVNLLFELGNLSIDLAYYEGTSDTFYSQ